MSVEAISMADAPFHCPPDTVLDVPVPPSVNVTRKVNWPGQRAYKAWKKQAGMHLMLNGQYRKAQKRIDRYELLIILDEEKCRLDPDNIKAASDFLKAINIIVDDGPKHARQITIKWGEAPEGMRLIVRACE